MEVVPHLWLTCESLLKSKHLLMKVPKAIFGGNVRFCEDSFVFVRVQSSSELSTVSEEMWPSSKTCRDRQ